MSKALSVARSYEMYGGLMIAAFKRYRETETMTVNLYKTVHFIRNNLYALTANPRFGTLVLWMQYNMPGTEEYADIVWDLLHVCVLPFEQQKTYVLSYQ